MCLSFCGAPLFASQNFVIYVSVAHRLLRRRLLILVCLSDVICIVLRHMQTHKLSIAYALCISVCLSVAHYLCLVLPNCCAGLQIASIHLHRFFYSQGIVYIVCALHGQS